MNGSKCAITQHDLKYLHKTITKSSFDNLGCPELTRDLEYITKRLEQSKKVLITQMSDLSKQCNKVVGIILKDLGNKIECLSSEHPLRDGVTLLEPLGLSGREVPLTMALAWLLDPGNNHDFGHTLVKYIVKYFNDKYFSNPGDTKIPDIITGIKFKVDSEYLIESGRLDILITINDTRSDYLIAIEAKVNAKESPYQLHKYQKELEKRFNNNCTFIFLSRRGVPKPSASKWIQLSYLELAMILLKAYHDKDINLRDKPGGLFLTLFIRSLIKDVEEIDLGSDLMLWALLPDFS